jgi:hypothetical protein
MADVALVVPDVPALRARGLAVACKFGLVAGEVACVVVPDVVAQLPTITLDGAVVLAQFTAILANVPAVCTDVAGEGGGYEE